MYVPPLVPPVLNNLDALIFRNCIWCRAIIIIMFMTTTQISDDRYRPKVFSAFLNIIFKSFTVSLWFPISLTCLPLFLLGVFVWGLPPIVSEPSRFYRYFSAVFTEGKPQDNIQFTNRILIFMLIFDTLVKAPVRGVFWFLDELLYPAYHRVNIEEPVFFITGPRSGSSQLCKYLEKDRQSFVIPTVIEGFAPYIWAWKLVVPIFTRLGIKMERFGELNILGTEAKKRHVFNLFTSDTWDTIFGALHLNQVILYLGISFMKWGYPFARLQQPIDEELYINEFIKYTDSVLKKVMYHRGIPAQRVLIKGHFLLAAQALEEKYPKAKFFVVVRQPTERICSFINLAKVLCSDGPGFMLLKPGLFPPSWRVIRDYAIATQIPYCEQEMSFYRKHQANKLIIPFTFYMKNLSATLQSIYSLCDIPIPDSVVSDAVVLQRTTHNPTTYRPNYDSEYDRSLASLGIDEEKIKKHLSVYIEWINSVENCNKTD